MTRLPKFRLRLWRQDDNHDPGPNPSPQPPPKHVAETAAELGTRANAAGFSSLPTELNIQILSHLSFSDHYAIYMTCKLWRSIISDEFLAQHYPDLKYLASQVHWLNGYRKVKEGQKFVPHVLLNTLGDGEVRKEKQEKLRKLAEYLGDKYLKVLGLNCNSVFNEPFCWPPLSRVEVEVHDLYREASALRREASGPDKFETLTIRKANSAVSLRDILEAADKKLLEWARDEKAAYGALMKPSSGQSKYYGNRLYSTPKRLPLDEKDRGKRGNYMWNYTAYSGVEWVTDNKFVMYLQ